ncbi:hypothetical protein HKBW3S43_00689 [Candidatus Hakubella thermalkaliphila]|uniref:Uncharacterized protein n=3 Tax=Candidatus Hakubella thermalkaliphila TaxID=2754717 RepID=A0A6V8P2V5_9ACTN|nr:hypothetical protein [Candidatus Hakubella thermalkaliphila]MBT9170582.1 hypothetical protein [Actinomycetota bacterium]GFP21239.1 hypothetical protein HKBW3S06_00465 [Candidatus Hakubella thermalkaliphila]GFP25126.1 hypothetical protein HKBW3S25_00576 [Candidatus Hakubella thermalkaliphila]GFP34897.1 hypothetical protein HKBW3S43_00689 [Candidatus Hakubella thermalkaliphila]
MSKTFCELCAHPHYYQGESFRCFYPCYMLDLLALKKNGRKIRSRKVENPDVCPFYDEEEFVEFLKGKGWYYHTYRSRKKRAV